MKVNNVARYILEHKGGHMSTMKLQKLVYYTQAWSLVWDEKPLFDSRIEAWANGPIIPDLYDQHRGLFAATIDTFPEDSGKLNEDEKDTIDVVLGAYGHLNGQQLSDLSHSERPWREARKGVEDGASSTNEVSKEVMQEFYSAMQSSSTQQEK